MCEIPRHRLRSCTCETVGSSAGAAYFHGPGTRRGGGVMASPAASAPDQFVVGCSVRAVIAASPEDLWTWIADPTRHPQFAGSGEPQSIEIVGDRMHGV